MLPWVVLSQVRRRATIGGIIFNIVFSGFFVVLFQRIPKEPFLDTPAGWFATLCVLAVWVIGGTLAVTYGPKDRPAAWSSPIFFATFVVTIATAAIIGVPALRVAAALGTSFGIGLLLSMPTAWQKTPPPLSLNSIDDHARLFQKAIWWRNAREAGAAVFVLTMNVRDLFTVQEPVKWTGHLPRG